ncbi:MAG: CoA transferase [Burkholderiales bacterium]|nr:CoA transferase [Burkholderiales bacterium]
MTSADTPPTPELASPQRPLPLTGTRVLSLALNLPGPAALMRLRDMGATCTKFEPPSGDPMAAYSPVAYADMHQGIGRLTADLKLASGQQTLHTALVDTDVLITSFRPSALRKLHLDFDSLHAAFPRLIMVGIVGAPGHRADEPGHDLTYMAEQDLVQDLSLPPTLYADMGGALATSEAVLQGLLTRHQTGRGCHLEVALSDAAHWLGKPRQWQLTTQAGDVGGAHAGYRVYACQDGRVAIAALEPHFAQRLCAAAGLPPNAYQAMREPAQHTALAAFCAAHSRQTLDKLAIQHDLPMHTLA